MTTAPAPLFHPRRFRKKPVEIEAFNFTAYTLALGPWSERPEGGELYQWLRSGGAEFELRQEKTGPAYLSIFTLEGWMRANVGDWIIKGVQGEFYPCKPGIFAASYVEAP